MKALLSLVTAGALLSLEPASAQDAAAGKAMSRASRAALMKQKQVNSWPRPGRNMRPVRVDLSVGECETLGGRLKVDNSCDFGITCVGSNGGRACITEMKGNF
jgi:hypothetical protein